MFAGDGNLVLVVPIRERLFLTMSNVALDWNGVNSRERKYGYAVDRAE